jgi:hypothetical protein
MKKLAIALSVMLIMGILGAGVLGKSYGKGGKDSENPASDNSNGNGWGKGGNPDKPGKGGETQSTGENLTEGNLTGSTEQTSGNGKGKNKTTPKYPADFNGLNKTRGRVRHLYLYEKNDTTWEPIPRGAWGKMTYRPSGKTFRYTFSAHGLSPGQNYSLIYYPDPWPGTGLFCLGNGTANRGGNIQISDRRDIDDIPTEEDENYQNGAKVWLVLTSDVDCFNQQMIGWNPGEYLFEYNLITYNKTA